MAAAWVAVALAGWVAVGVGAVATERPVIGVFAQPKTSDYCGNSTSCQYIAASYIKFVESHGGRAVPIDYYATDDEVEALFGSVNGMLIPGGGSAVSSGAYKAYALAKEANDAGETFPILGICMGFEWLLQLAGGALDTGFDSENVSLPLNMTEAAATSRFFSGLDSSLYELLQSPKSTAFNNHMAGITPEHFDGYTDLADTFTVLSTSADRNGVEFVSTMEAKDYPFYGTQWHPEKNVWELGETATGLPYENIPHTADAIDITLYISKFFMAQARESTHSFADPAKEQSSIMWQFPVYFTGPEFVQSYITGDFGLYL